MSETRFTPGPWGVRRTEWDTIQVMIGPPGDQVGICEASAFDQKSEANAHLIAAAPDLYAALHALVWDGPAVDDSPLWEAARAALAKARGEEPR